MGKRLTLGSIDLMMQAREKVIEGLGLLESDAWETLKGKLRVESRV